MENAEFEQLVNQYYEALYRFALSLTRSEAASCDLTQQTFYLWAAKGHQLRDRTKAKSWLFTTLHREFLGSKRRETRFPHHEMKEVDHELPTVLPTVVNDLDGSTVMESLLLVDELYRAPLMLFYLEDFSYQEIAEQLEIPIGTVMSRLNRGKAQLRQLVAGASQSKSEKIISLNDTRKEAKSRG
ncbi:MAG: polymerase subunit sigma-24 [Verrucomicrobia bacterium]|jgi:RNA polymerase sigma-70 factor (ECF subfamily)|nr:polymerase subunit sigma-24 [Verrucomicrobiota bacterium]